MPVAFSAMLLYNSVLGALNPGLRVPTLVLDDGRPLGESNAILWYFGDGTQFVPEDAYERAQVLQWCFLSRTDHKEQDCLREAPSIRWRPLCGPESERTPRRGSV